MSAADLGLATGGLDSVTGGGPEENARIFGRILEGEQGPHRDIVVLNAAAGLVVAGVVDEPAEGVSAAAAAIDDGSAASTLERLREVTNGLRPVGD